jgi:hypothetical protein
MKPYNEVQQQKKIRKKALLGKTMVLGITGTVVLSSLGGVGIKAFAATPTQQLSPSVKTISEYIGGTYSGFVGDTVQDLINYLSDGASNVQVGDPTSNSLLSPSEPLKNGVVYHASSSQGEINFFS